MVQGWRNHFVVLRLTEGGILQQVYASDDLKHSKYWLTYIAQVGDVLCRTPAHPKHSHASQNPEYWSHKEASGKTLSNEGTWRKWLEKQCPSPWFPDTQLAGGTEGSSEEPH